MAQSELQSIREELLAKLASKEEVAEVKKDVSGLKHDVSGLKQDVSGLKQDVSGLKQDVSGLKQDVSGLKSDFNELKEKVSSIEEKVDRHSETLSKLTSLVLDLRENAATKQELDEKFDQIIRGQDTLVKMLERKDHEMTAQDAKSYRLETDIKTESQRNDLQDKMLKHHDSRIKQLESVAS